MSNGNDEVLLQCLKIRLFSEIQIIKSSHLKKKECYQAPPHLTKGIKILKVRKTHKITYNKGNALLINNSVSFFHD